MAHPNITGRTYCESCKKLEAQFDYQALSTLLGLFLLFMFWGGSVVVLTRSGVLFQMLDVDDSGTIEVGEYRGR